VLRQPIVCILGHVDHGKTTLLDRIRKTSVASKEPGLITQHVGCTSVPKDVIEEISGDLMKKMNIKLEIPGLLFLDTPGHEAFTTLRERGGKCADLAVLVIDVNEGMKPQTVESLEFLKKFRTPFVVAATKIDKIRGWIPKEDSPFLESFAVQPENVKQELENRIYSLVAQLLEHGFESERFDRVRDFRKTVAIVPCSGATGEGIPELLMVLGGLSQAFLRERITVKSEIASGTVLEVKETKGMGITIDVLLTDGEIKKGDYMVFKDGNTTKIRALFIPPPLSEIRTEKKFIPVDRVSAACGVKVSAPGLEKVVAGTPFVCVSDKKDVEQARKKLSEMIRRRLELSGEGVVVKADTLGSLEAVVKLMKEKNVPIKKAEVGAVTKSDIILASNRFGVVIAFNVSVDRAAREEASSRGVKIIENNVIYRLVEEYDKWIEEKEEEEKRRALSEVTYPCVFRVLPGFVFRVSSPAIVGVEVISGVLKPGSVVVKPGKEVGKIKEIQKEGVSVPELAAGDRGAVSIEGGVVGRNFREGDELYVLPPENDVRVFEKYLPDLAELSRVIKEKLTKAGK